jgi:uncharacterized membrane protein
MADVRPAPHRRRRTLPALALATLLAAAGVTHFARPGFYAPIVPAQLGDPLPWVYVSGAAELACAAGVAVPRTRRAAAWATAALFVAVFPANVVMALDVADRSIAYRAVTYARLPGQVPLVLWAVWVALRAGSTGRYGRSS